MSVRPTQKLNPKIKNVWRINDAFWIVVGFLCCMIPVLILLLAEVDDALIGFLAIGIIVAFIVLLILFLFVLPPLRYMRWRYELTDTFLIIEKGIFWRNHYVIPFIRVQNTDTRQGPILRAFHLSSVTVSTAAGSHEIPGIDTLNAEQLRDHAAELARVAREDV